MIEHAEILDLVNVLSHYCQADRERDVHFRTLFLLAERRVALEQIVLRLRSMADVSDPNGLLELVANAEDWELSKLACRTVGRWVNHGLFPGTAVMDDLAPVEDNGRNS